MNVLFCYDAEVKKNPKTQEYYGVVIDNNWIKRYESFGGKVKLALKYKGNIEDGYNNSRKLSYEIIECPELSSITTLLKNTKKCKKILEEQIKLADIVIARLPSLIGNIAFELAKKHKKKCIVEVVGCIFDAYWNYGVKGKILAPISYLIMRNKVKRAKNVIYVTNKFLQKRYPNNQNNIGCSDVVLNKTDKKILDERIMKISNSDNSVINIATVAAVSVKYKGQQDIIKAIYELKKMGYKIKYKVIGSGSNTRLKLLSEKLKLQEEIEFLGNVRHEEIFSKLRDIDIYVQPSYQEGLCRALIEAMSMGCPCICSNAGGNFELIEKKYIYNKKNIRQFIAAFKQMDNTELKDQAIKNFNKAKSFDAEELIRKREKMFMRVKHDNK